MKRPIRAMNLPDVEAVPVVTGAPIFEWADPTELLVDEAYQRNLSHRSVQLIRRIVARWDWRRFKPPVVARTEAGLEVIDGQHTAIAAATRPDITQIPIMIVDAAVMADRAAAFIGHNRDRVTVTSTQLHAVAVAAGDEDALTIEQVCARAGVTLLKTPPSNGHWKPRETIALASVRGLVRRRNPMKARQVLQVLAEAELAPVSADAIKAADMLLHESEYAGQVQAADLTSTIRGLGAAGEREARVFAAAHGVPLWRALGVTWFKEVRRGRRQKA